MHDGRAKALNTGRARAAAVFLRLLDRAPARPEPPDEIDVEHVEAELPRARAHEPRALLLPPTGQSAPALALLALVLLDLCVVPWREREGLSVIPESSAAAAAEGITHANAVSPHDSSHAAPSSACFVVCTKMMPRPRVAPSRARQRMAARRSAANAVSTVAFGSAFMSTVRYFSSGRSSDFARTIRRSWGPGRIAHASAMPLQPARPAVAVSARIGGGLAAA